MIFSFCISFPFTAKLLRTVADIVNRRNDMIVNFLILVIAIINTILVALYYKT